MLEELNTKTRVKYLARVTNPAVPPKSGGHDHGHGHGHAAAPSNGAGGKA